MLISNNGLNAARLELFALAVVDSTNLSQHVLSLDEDAASNLWCCLHRIGLTDDESLDCRSKILHWLQSDNIMCGYGDDAKTATFPERIKDAISCIGAVHSNVAISPKSCCEAFSTFRTWSVGPSVDSSPFRLPRGETWQKNCDTSTIDDEVFRLLFDDELISHIVTSAAEMFGDERLKYSASLARSMEGREAHPIVFANEIKRQMGYILESIVATWQKAIFNGGELPAGWQISSSGTVYPVRNKDELREWLTAWLTAIHDARATPNRYNNPEDYLEDIRRELGNTRKALREWKQSPPVGFNDEPEDIRSAEKQLESIIDHLGCTPCAAEPNSNDLPANPVDVRNRFIRLARSIIETIDYPPDETHWWQEAERLTWALEETRRQIKFRDDWKTIHPEHEKLVELIRPEDCPALLIVTRNKMDAVPAVADGFKQLQKLAPDAIWNSVTTMVFSDPWKRVWIGSHHLNTVAETGKEEVHATATTRREIVFRLKAWIQAVEHLSDDVSSTAPAGEKDKKEPDIVSRVLPRLQELLHYLQSGMKGTATDLIRTQLMNSASNYPGFLVESINALSGMKEGLVLRDSLPAVMNLCGIPAPKLFGESGLYPNLSESERWQKSVEILHGVVKTLIQYQLRTQFPTDGPLKAIDATVNNSQGHDEFAEPKNEVRRPGHSKDIPYLRDDVAEVLRLQKLKSWKDKNPIDVCRHYVRENTAGLSEEQSEKDAQTLKRYLNRYLKDLREAT